MKETAPPGSRLRTRNVIQVAVTLFLVAFVVDAIASWEELAKFQVLILGYTAGICTALGVVYGILRHKNKPKPTGTRYKGQYL